MDIFDLFKPNVEKLEAKRDVEGLIKALNYKKDLKVRWEAAVALGEIKDKKAVEPLFQALKDESKWVQEESAEALGKIGEPAGESLIQALKHESERVRRKQQSFLGRWDFRALYKLLNRYLSEKELHTLKKLLSIMFSRSAIHL